jgi:hypothetical protein
MCWRVYSYLRFERHGLNLREAISISFQKFKEFKLSIAKIPAIASVNYSLSYA